jgi:hypothetical protein
MKRRTHCYGRKGGHSLSAYSPASEHGYFMVTHNLLIITPHVELWRENASGRAGFTLSVTGRSESAD